MAREEILKKVTTILIEMLLVEDVIEEETSLIDNLVMDSIQLLEFIIKLEETFGICVKPEKLSAELFDRVGAVVDFIEKNID